MGSWRLGAPELSLWSRQRAFCADPFELFEGEGLEDEGKRLSGLMEVESLETTQTLDGFTSITSTIGVRSGSKAPVGTRGRAGSKRAAPAPTLAGLVKLLFSFRREPIGPRLPCDYNRNAERGPRSVVVDYRIALSRGVEAPEDILQVRVI
jgi:hypothetical protein